MRLGDLLFDLGRITWPQRYDPLAINKAYRQLLHDISTELRDRDEQARRQPPERLAEGEPVEG